MYSKINGEIHYPECERRLRAQSRSKQTLLTPRASHVGSVRTSGRSCGEELCPDCGKVQYFPEQVESFALHQSVDEYIE